MQAFALHPIIPQLDAKVSAVCVHGPSEGKIVVIGTDEGKLMSYAVKADERTKTFIPHLEQLKSAGHGKKPITDMVSFKEVGLLLTICDGCLDVWNAISLEPSVPVPQNKSISKVCVYNGNEMSFQIGVVQKKKLILYEFTGRFSMLKEINLPEQPHEIAWLNDYIYLGYKKDYQIMNIHTGMTASLATFETEPMIRILNKSEIVLRQDKKGLVYRIKDSDFAKGTMTPSHTVPWSTIVKDFVAHYPYVLSIQKEELEVHSTITWKLQQALPCATQNLKGIVEATDGWALTFSSKAIYAIVAAPFPQQAEQLIHVGYIDEGIELLKATCSTRKDFPALMQSLNELAGLKKLRMLDWTKAFVFLVRAQYNPRLLINDTFPMLQLHPPVQPLGELHIRSIVSKAKVGATHGEIDKTIKSALLALIDLLEEARKGRWGKDRVVSLDIYVALFKLYAEVRPEALGSFLATIPDDGLPLEPLEKYCQDDQHWYALGWLYKKFLMNRKALDIWAKLGSGDKKDGDANGIEESVMLLSEISDIEIITEFSPWIYKANRNRFKDIFTSNARKTLLPLQQISNFLAQFGRVMIEAYLEWLVLERRSPDDKAETALAWHYLETVLALLQAAPKDSVSSGSGPAASSGLLGPARAKLVNLLQTHSNYSPHQILARIQALPLYNEKIILYQKIGQHDKALQIIVDDIKDYPRAEHYCLQHGDEAARNAVGDSGSSVRFNPLLLALLRMYIAMESNESVPTKSIDLLNKFPKIIDPSLAIQVLSSKLPLKVLMNYLPIALRDSTHSFREGQVMKNLEKSQNLKVRGRKIQKIGKSIIITRDVVCPLCGKPIGDKVFAYYPNGCVIHYKCYQQLPANTAQYICPVTGRNFLADPM